MAGCHLRERRYDGADDKQRAFFDRLGEFCTYIGRNSEEIPNYGERYRCGEPISTLNASPDWEVFAYLTKASPMRVCC